MKLFVSICMCVALLSCGEKPVGAVDTVKDDPKVECFVGVAVDKEWPYRYTLVRGESGWSGEVEYCWEDDAIYFDKMEVISSSDRTIHFEALLGGPGKALPMEWNLSLTKKEAVMEAVLTRVGGSKDEEPIKLIFQKVDSVVLPSRQLEDKVRDHHDARYRTEKAHKENLKVHAYTVKNNQHLQHALTSGADGCFADFPQEVIRVLR